MFFNYVLNFTFYNTSEEYLISFNKKKKNKCRHYLLKFQFLLESSRLTNVADTCYVKPFCFLSTTEILSCRCSHCINVYLIFSHSLLSSVYNTCVFETSELNIHRSNSAFSLRFIHMVCDDRHLGVSDTKKIDVFSQKSLDIICQAYWGNK